MEIDPVLAVPAGTGVEQAHSVGQTAAAVVVCPWTVVVVAQIAGDNVVVVVVGDIVDAASAVETPAGSSAVVEASVQASVAADSAEGTAV